MDWQSKLRRIQDDTFHVNWEDHIAALNEGLRLEPKTGFRRRARACLRRSSRAILTLFGPEHGPS